MRDRGKRLPRAPHQDTMQVEPYCLGLIRAAPSDNDPMLCVAGECLVFIRVAKGLYRDARHCFVSPIFRGRTHRIIASCDCTVSQLRKDPKVQKCCCTAALAWTATK